MESAEPMGGKTDIFYDPPAERGTVGELAGDSLTVPGKTVSLDDYRGQVVVLNVWGSWCGPCRSEADDLVRVAGADFTRDFGLTYPSIFDPPGRTLFALGGAPRAVVPLTVVLDRQHWVSLRSSCANSSPRACSR